MNNIFRKFSSAFLAVMMVFSTLTIPASAEEANNVTESFSSDSGISLAAADWQQSETVVVYSTEFSGKEMAFTRNRLTISASATALSGSVPSITVKLKKQVVGNIYSTVSTATLYPTGSSQNLFRDVVITPNANYKIFYQINGGDAAASARVFLAAVTWQQ